MRKWKRKGRKEFVYGRKEDVGVEQGVVWSEFNSYTKKAEERGRRGALNTA